MQPEPECYIKLNENTYLICSINYFCYIIQLIPIVTFCLGCWQVQRLRWKRELIVHLDAKLGAAPIDLPEELVSNIN